MRNCIAVFLLLLIPCISKGQTQTYYQYKTDEATLVFFDKNLSRYIPHMIRMYQNGKALHTSTLQVNDTVSCSSTNIRTSS